MKPKAPEFIRYHRKDGSFVALVSYGRKWDRMLLVDRLPIHVGRVPANERKYYTNIGSVSDGVALFTKLKERQQFTKGADTFLELMRNVK